jgi:hypothetical protein
MAAHPSTSGRHRRRPARRCPARRCEPRPTAPRRGRAGGPACPRAVAQHQARRRRRRPSRREKSAPHSAPASSPTSPAAVLALVVDFICDDCGPRRRAAQLLLAGRARAPAHAARERAEARTGAVYICTLVRGRDAPGPGRAGSPLSNDRYHVTDCLNPPQGRPSRPTG